MRAFSRLAFSGVIAAIAEVEAVLPGALADVRAWVRKVNNLPG